MDPGPWKRKVEALEARIRVSLADFGVATQRADAANFRDLWADSEGAEMLLSHTLTKWPRNEQTEALKEVWTPT